MQTITTSHIVEAFSFLEQPWELPEVPVCRRCKTPLEMKILYEEGEAEVYYVCRVCKKAVYQTAD